LSIKNGVMSAPLRLIFVSLLWVSSLSAEPTPWTQLRIGMSADELVSVLGDPVFRRHGRGFETWTYDQGAEVLVYGIVVGWTTPADSRLKIHSRDVWADHPKGAFMPTLHTALRKAARPPARPVATAEPPSPASPAGAGMGYEEYLRALRETKT
jgi:hypothetical protein